MLKTGNTLIDAETAFTRARRGARMRKLRRARVQLPVYTGAHPVAATGGVREIALDEIRGTLEPSRATQFDERFAPVRAAARRRWESIWTAEERGVALPPISVVRVRDGYAVRDGHHRVSVARARGAVAIDAAIGV
ncbi:ParB N-terminal domain-containing protein [Solirubrobacter sp. CPCC 204708]|uniref:ParB N-terminal domain-containing protein n=1 Tax=Solirubrobacter deserti TaxID=2282478 RepID=A0ABT4RDL9_9ACTN|nr:ParB N-terminal domain-containing protein [Solirubrobacter deserti]MBE2314627.1 ParB N-terminal domain-containing protein [Solirubrobacter deserti]MDA0136634.1 ParB N-terminal domain-containing protein [Solirubrobacter deserti]